MISSAFGQHVQKFLYILGDKQKTFFILIISFLFLSLLETVGVGLVGPFVGVAINPQAIHQSKRLQQLYEALNLTSELPIIASLGVAVVAILCIKAVLGFHIQRNIFRFGYGQQEELRLKLIYRYHRIPYVVHLSQSTANLIDSILGDTSRFANGYLMPLLFFTSNLIITLALIFLLFISDFSATVAILAGLLVTAFVLYSFRNKIYQWGLEKARAEREMVRIVEHSVGSFKESRIIGCESYFEDQMAEQSKKYSAIASAFSVFQSLPRYLIEILLIGFLVGFVLMCLATERSPQSLTATLSVFGMASVRLIPTTSLLAHSITTIRNNSFTIDVLYNDLRRYEDLGTAASASKSAIGAALPNLTKTHQNRQGVGVLGQGDRTIRRGLQREVALENITYTYPGSSTPTLSNISLKIAKGESIALIGRSGAGKTTLVDLILGLLTPDSGDIRVDGRSYAEDLRSWQQLIGYIPQTIFLSDDTIEHNIAFGVPDAEIDQQRLLQAIQMAQLSELIAQLPEGVKTEVGERGVRLSGGQRQRIGIARALYHHREILVLDEATAALDNETEHLVTEAIKSLGGVKTLIIIAHRLSTVAHCDRIYLMDKGQILKSGRYHEVVTSDGRFAHPLADQFSLSAPES